MAWAVVFLHFLPDLPLFHDLTLFFLPFSDYSLFSPIFGKFFAVGDTLPLDPHGGYATDYNPFEKKKIPNL